MNINDYKKNILDCINQARSVTFVDIQRYLRSKHIEFDGGYGITAPNHSDIYLWSGWNQEAAMAIKELFKENKIAMQVITVEEHLRSGGRMNCPATTEPGPKDAERWLPVRLLPREDAPV